MALSRDVLDAHIIQAEMVREAAKAAYNVAWDVLKDAKAAYDVDSAAFKDAKAKFVAAWDARKAADEAVEAAEAARDAEDKPAWVEVPDNGIECICGCKNDIDFADFGGGIVDLIIHGEKGVVCVGLDAPKLTALKALIEEALADVE